MKRHDLTAQTLNKELMKENKTILRLKDKVSAELYTLLTTGRVLQLTLKREWYLKIASGEKREEYRTINEYWAKRFTNNYFLAKPHTLDSDGMKRYINYLANGSALDLEPKEELPFTSTANKWDLILFKNGYRKDSPITITDSKGLEIKQGVERWGAVAKQFYFTLKLGNVLYTEPCS
jgi:hypothetical protein